MSNESSQKNFNNSSDKEINLEKEETKNLDTELDLSKEERNNEYKFHPLERSWTLWYDCPSKKYTNNNYELNKVYTFDTVESFWRFL